MHVEAGYDLPATLLRCFDQCKRAVLRGIGPVNKAAELRPEDARGPAAGQDPSWG